MKLRHARLCALSALFACAGAFPGLAQQKPLDEVKGCLERAKVEKYISDHNYAELLRGAASDGTTHAIWTNGRQALIVSYLRPADDKMDDLKTICVSGVADAVSFNLYVIEKLVSSAKSSLEKK